MGMIAVVYLVLVELTVKLILMTVVQILVMEMPRIAQTWSTIFSAAVNQDIGKFFLSFCLE